MSVIRFSGLAISLLSMAAAAQEAPSAAAVKPVATDVAHSASQQCRAHPTVSACDDALRWNPSDPSLLISMGDALVRVKRTADAVRAYQRAATLAPDLPGVKAKIEAAQGLSGKAKGKTPIRDAAAPPAAAGKRFSNSDPDTQTH